MTYITKEVLKKDERFFVDDRNIDRLTKEPILRYSVKQKKIGMLLRNRARTGKIVTLDKTRVYAYLTGTEKGEKEYDEYIDICNVKFRSKAAYNSLIDEMSHTPYDIKKGAIVINQDDLIYDGQHRSCYLLYKYGPNYKVEVLQLFYHTGRGVGRVILKLQLYIAKMRAFFLCLFNR